MLRHYLVLAVKVLLRRKFFTFISLFGISFTLVVLTVATAMLDHAFGPGVPETRQDRMLGVHRAVMYGPHSTWSSAAGFKLLDRYARDLPGVERLSIYSGAVTVFSYIGGEKIRSSLKRTDGEYWRILEFSFLEGNPYSTRDVEEAAFVAVINEATRRKFFGESAAAVGRTIEADGQRFRVVGVVENVSRMRTIGYADIWVPYTTAKTDSYRGEMMGNFEAIALARDRAALPALREEFNSRLLRAELPDPKEYTAIVAPFDTRFAAFARELPISDRQSTESQAWRIGGLLAGIAALFVLLPTVNLININMSRIMERASEIGVRKAFGAPSRSLIGQFVVENVLLTLVGAFVAFGISMLVLRGINDSGVIRHAALAVNVRVFAYGVLIAVVFGVVSGVYPAWRLSRLHPVEALKGVSR